MKQGLQTKLFTRVMVIATIALVGAAVVNYHQRQVFELPDDGVQWVDTEAGVEALMVEPDGPGWQAGIRSGDRLLRINNIRVQEALDVPQVLTAIGAWNRAVYGVARDGVDFNAPLIIRAASYQQPFVSYFLLLVGVAYLAIGVFVFARRAMRPMVRHFYLFCLTSFILYSFSYTGSLTGFDRFIYWGDVWATVLVPAIFLHFCLIFPRAQLATPRRRFLARLGYAPVLGMLAVHHLAAAGILDTGFDLVELREILDRIEYALLGAYFVAGAAILNFLSAGSNETVVIRQQRKWLAQGTLWGVLPFVAFYVWPFVTGGAPGPNQSLSVFSLGLIPLTFAYAIVKYRLMDVDVILRRGVAYTLATVTLLAAFYGLLFLLGGMVQPELKELSPAAWVLSVVAAALLFQPLRSWIQTKLEERFYRERYDYRRTLVDFASELSAEPDLERALSSFTDRLVTSLGLSRIAVFVADQSEDDGPPRGFRLVKGVGLTDAHGSAIERGAALDLTFLEKEFPRTNGSHPYMFFENPRRCAGYGESVRRTIVDLDLHYYVPCGVRGRTIAYIGLGRTAAGDLLSSDDISLVQAASGYFAVALENARLVQSLERKAVEYQRLKDYNENIVESLNVGILALDLEGRVESWNTQLELTFGIPRRRAVGRRLAELLPADLVAEIDRLPEDSGIQNIYKFRLRAERFPAEFRPEPARDSAASGKSKTAANGSAGEASAERILNLAVAPLVTKSFAKIGRLIIFDDVTERVELEEQLVEADKLSSIGLLAAGVAHEVNTPLAVISSYAQMLAKRIADDPQKTKILDKITSQTFRASEIVNSLLNVSRTSPKEFTELDLSQILIETLALAAPQLEKADVKVQTRFETDAAVVAGNAGRLQQVFLNLFMNARDAMPEGGRLTVRTEIPEHEGDEAVVRVTVSDTGGGIAPDHLKRVFDPFFTTKARNRGTGLGLAVSYGIIQEHSGTMSVESEPGRGASFQIELPLVRKPVHA